MLLSKAPSGFGQLCSTARSLGRAGAGLLILGPIMACSILTEPDPRVQLLSTEPGQAPDGQPNVTAVAGNGQITLRGFIRTGDPCRSFSGAVSLDDSILQVRIIALRNSENCFPVLASFAYEALVTDLDPGTYRLRVDHVSIGSAVEVLESVSEVK